MSDWLIARPKMALALYTLLHCFWVWKLLGATEPGWIVWCTMLALGTLYPMYCAIERLRS